jgi:hypothetical protein
MEGADRRAGHLCKDVTVERAASRSLGAHRRATCPHRAGSLYRRGPPGVPVRAAQADVQRAVGFLLAVARELGRHLGTGELDECRQHLLETTTLTPEAS